MTARALSIIVADSIRREANGKLLVVGMYTRVNLEEAPSEDSLNTLAIFATLIGLKKGKHEASFQIIDLDGEGKFEVELDLIVSKGPKFVIPVMFEVTDFYFPTSGRYVFSLKLGEQRVAEHFAIVKFPSEEIDAGA